jgi:type IV pilus assembly protein PilN
LIKINLLAVDRERAKRKAKFQIGQKITVGCSLILVAAALGIGWWYWHLERTSADLDQQIVDAEAERVRLQSVIQQVQQFEARRAQLQQRVTLIEQLRKGQTGPVHLLDEVSRALPDTMWLTSLRQTATEVLFDGRCISLDGDCRQPAGAGSGRRSGIGSIFGAREACGACDGQLMRPATGPDI